MKVAIVVFVLTERYINLFNYKFKNNLLNYCSKYSYDLIILNEMIEDDGENKGNQVLNKKKFFWQRLLIPNKFTCQKKNQKQLTNYQFDYLNF